MAFFIIIPAVIFFVLWMLESKKNQGIKDAEEYIANKKAEGDALLAKKSAEGKAILEQKIAEGETLLEQKRKEASDYYQQQTERAAQKVKEAQRQVRELTKEKNTLIQEIDTLYSNQLCSMTDIEAYSNMRSDEIKNQLSLLKLQQTDAIKSGSAVSVSYNEKLKRVIETEKKQILRCFNAESTSIIENITVKNVDASRNKLQRSFEAINKMFSSSDVQITREFLSMKFEELSLVYAYMVKVEEEKEQRRAIREQMMEEEKVRREIERAKQKIDKEITQFNNEIKKLMAYMHKSRDDIERQLYIDKIHELEDKLAALTADKENVLQREQNTRAGFVYIISNIGSFGECIYKIGMTRRLEPMDRIHELSSASVPFPFDVHAMIFSEDAPALETLLHRHFQESQVNKVNPRKEFFHIDLDEIKHFIQENYSETVRFEDIPDAFEYRETLKLVEAAKAAE